VEKIRIKDIIIDPRFRKDYGDIEGLAASLARFDLIHPIVLDQDHRLVAGGRRLAAAAHLGWEEITFIRRHDLDEVARRELELEENLKRKDMTWVEEVRAVRSLYELRQSRYGEQGSRTQVGEALGLTGGYSMQDAATELDRSKGSIVMDINLARALDEFPELSDEQTKAAAWRRYHREKELQTRQELARRDQSRREQEQQVTERQEAKERGEEPEDAPRVPRSQALDIAQANVHQQIRKAGFQGKGTIYWADSRDLLRLLAERHMHFDCIACDPPFGLGLFKKGQTTTGTRLAEAEGGMYDDDPHKIMDMLDEVFMWAAKLLKPDGHAYIFFHMTRYEEVYQMVRKHFGTCEETPLIWSKNTPAIGDPNISYVYSYEPCFFVNRGRHMVKPQAFNVLRYDTVPPSQKIHPTQKPTALLRHLLQASCVPGETVLDPFCGSGSTLVAASQVGCHFIGVEREEAFYRKAIDFVAEGIASEANEREVGGDG